MRKGDFGSGSLSSDEAVEKTARQEKELNRLLARVTDVARTRRGVQS